jgi:hypothetical protein
MISDPMVKPSRTPWQTELKWLLAVSVFAIGVAGGGTIWVLWRLWAASAGC